MEEPPAQYDIFLSHSGKQKGIIRDLEKKLSSCGYSVFFDENDDSLPPGQRFPDRIFSAAKTCKLAIVALSDDFLTSRWPMIELCAFAERLPSSHASLTILPLFLKLSPDDLKKKEKVEEWRKSWEGFELQDAQKALEKFALQGAQKASERFEPQDAPRRLFSAKKCEEAVKLLPPLNGIRRRLESEQGESSFIDEVVDKICVILPLSQKFTIPGKQFSGRDRLCNVILDTFKELEAHRPSTSEAHSCILSMYGAPGSGKSTLCTFLCESMYHEFRRNVIYLALPTVLNPHHESADNQLLTTRYADILSRFTPSKYIASMDLNKVRNQFNNHARSSQKMLLVLDNISPYNYRSYMEMAQDILGSAILGSGSRILLVARSPAILQRLLTEVKIPEKCFRYATIEVPCLTEAEAMEIIRNQYPSVKEDLMTPLLQNSSFRSSSSTYIPFVFEQIGVFLKTNGSMDVEEVQLLWTMVAEGKNDAVKQLVDLNFKLLPKGLQVLFFDLVLFVIPSGYVKVDDAARVLSHIHGTVNTSVVKLKITNDLQTHCSLSIFEEMLHIHDIFIEYAENLPENSESYVYRPWSDILFAALSPSVPARVDLKTFLLARTIKIGGFTESTFHHYRDVAHQDICLRVEIGAKTKAMHVRSDSRHSKCILELSGDLSSLACLEVKNVWQVVISTSAGDADLSNLVRLELTNDANKADTKIVPWSGSQERKWMSRLLEFVSHQVQSSAQSIKWLLRPLFLWDQWSLPSCKQHVSSLATLGRLTRLQELVLANAGVQRLHLEDIGRCCPLLEDLEVRDEAHELMFVSIGNAPKMKRLVIGQSFFIKRVSLFSTWEYGRAKLRPKKSSELVLQLLESHELRQLWVDVCMFEKVKVIGSVPSKVRHLALANNTSVEVLPTMLISSSRQLLHLDILELHCSKVERLNFMRESVGRLHSLTQLDLVSCASLTHLYVDVSCLPRLQRFNVTNCEKLQVFEGLGDILLKGQLKNLNLRRLPQLFCKLWLGGVQLEKLIVHECHGLKINYNMLESSKSLKHLDLIETCVVLVQTKQSDLFNAVTLMGHSLQCIEFISLDRISVLHMDEDIKDISADQHGAGMLVSFDHQRSNMQSEILHGPSSMSLPAFQNQLSFWEGRFSLLGYLNLNGLEHLQEVEGIQNLVMLQSIYLLNLPNLIRISGVWPSRIGTIMLSVCPMLQEIPCLEHTLELQSLKCVQCPKLKAVEGCFRQMKRLMVSCDVHFVECESMDVFPMGDVISELGKRRREDKRWMFWRVTGGKFSVRGSKFASMDVMQGWLRDAEFGSHLFEAAVQGLMWEFFKKDAKDAMDALDDYFSALSPDIAENAADLLYLRYLFFPCEFRGAFFCGLGEREISVIQSWMSDKFPQPPYEHHHPRLIRGGHVRV